MLWFSRVKNNPSSQLLLALLTLELLSFLAWHWPLLSPWFLGLMALALILTLRFYPLAAFFIPVFELFNGAMGRSLSFGLLSLRILIFSIIVLYYLWYFYRSNKPIKLKEQVKLWRLYLAGLGLLLWSLINAYWHQAKIDNIFFDFNNYLYFLYLPIWYQLYEPAHWSKLWSGLKLIAIYLSLKTLVVFSIFSQIDYQYLVGFYKWLRDTRWAEITLVDNNFYRIFSQSQIFILIVWLGLWLKQASSLKNYKNLFFIILCSSALLISLSRSFWLGGVAGFLLMLVAYRLMKIFSLKILLKQIFIVFIASTALVMLLYNTPKFNGGNLFQLNRVNSAEPALSSRQALLGPLQAAISEQLYLGYGLGKEISYFSDDPRIKNITNPQGEYTTYALEWGWLDFVLKFGLIGTVYILFCLALIFKQAYVIIKKDQLGIFLAASLLTLMIIHFFSPYLNHPLGIAWLMIIIIYFYQRPVNSVVTTN